MSNHVPYILVQDDNKFVLEGHANPNCFLLFFNFYSKVLIEYANIDHWTVDIFANSYLYKHS